MQEIANYFIDTGTQCWACPLFDKLFAIVSNTTGAMYERLTFFCVLIFSVLFAFYVLNAFWQNLKSGMSDNFFQQSIKPVLINSVLALSLLALGLNVPKIISQITFEPVATITLEYSKIMLPDDIKTTNKYQPTELKDTGFFNVELRDTILQILQNSVTGFQVFIKFGVAVIDSAFSFPKKLDFSLLIKRFLVVIVGLYLTYYFAKFFIQYSICFLDIIVAMALFAFFFPFSLVFFIFRNAKDVPSWMKNLGDNLQKNIKSLINAIVSVVGAILTYTVILLIIRGYLNGNEINTDSVENVSESLFNFNIDNPSAIQVTFFGIIALVFIIKYLANKKLDVTKEIFSAFGVQANDSLSKEMGKNVFELTNIVAQQTKQVVKNIINPEAKKEDTKQKTDTKEAKK